MAYKVGNRFIIEIDRVYASKKHQNSRYGVKGFENWVVTKRNLDQLLERNVIDDADDAIKTAYDQGVEWGKALERETTPKLWNDECIQHLQRDGWMRDHDEAISKSEYGKGYTAGLNDAWTFAEHLAYVSEDVVNSIYISANGGKGLLVAMNMTYQEAKKVYDEYFEKKAAAEFSVGDEAVQIGNEFIRAIVAKAIDDKLWLVGPAGTYSCHPMSVWAKTGRHFDQYDELMKELGDEDG